MSRATCLIPRFIGYLRLTLKDLITENAKSLQSFLYTPSPDCIIFARLGTDEN